ncbi:tyrosine-type recombinase/integrase [Bdellovibrio sp. HCB209]|uniref:tyrosine-type recombinase/integrase n=1 Tax=Bdellovibrio sp. HCB209 TaxID=3394354 RepID=UPI0039B60B37
MAWTKRKDKKSGELYYSFTIYNPKTKKPERLRKEDTFFIKTDEEADRFLANKKAESNATALRIQKKLAWQKKYHDFENELLPAYQKDRQEKAPNSWANSMLYMRQYVLPYFLNELNANNPLAWNLHYDKFREHLLKVQKTRGTGPIAYNTRNHIIIALNTFVEFVAKRGGMREDLYKCELFEEHLMNKRTLADIYRPHEIDTLVTNLGEIDQNSKEFFIILYRTGMRINEARGLSLHDVVAGAIPKENIDKMLKKFGISTRAYIHLSTQPKVHRKAEIRDETGSIERKDLKGKRKKKVEEKDRYVAMWEDDAISIIKARRSLQLDLMKKKVWTDKMSDYLLFDEIIISAFERHLQAACEKAQIKYRSPHSLRHYFGTVLADITFGNHQIAQMMMGHDDPQTTAGYVHLAAQLQEETVKKKQVNNTDWDDL